MDQDEAPKGHRARRIAIAVHKGGVAKTTTAVTAGHALAFKPKRYKVLLIDCDPQGNATMTLGQQKPTSYEQNFGSLFFDDNLKLSHCIYPSKYPNLDILPNCITTYPRVNNIRDDSEQFYYCLRDKFEQESQILDYYDYILFDCPPHIGGPFLMNAMCAAKYALIPVEAEGVYGLAGVDQFLEVFKVAKQMNEDLELLKILITFFNAKQKASQVMCANIIKYFGEDNVFNTRIRRTTTISQANIELESVIALDTRHIGSIDYRAFAKELDDLLNEKEGR